MMSGIGGMVGIDPSQMRKRGFEKADGNGDGAIDKTELGKMLSKMSEVSGKSMDVSETMKSFDEDGSGTLNQDEADKMVQSVMGDMMSQAKTGMPSSYGATGSGKDTFSTLLDMLKKSDNSSSASSSDAASGKDTLSALLEQLKKSDNNQDTKSAIASFFQSYQPFSTKA